MPNEFLTPQKIATTAIATLYDSCVMAQLVHRDYEREFLPGVGNTITVRKPATFEAREYNRANGIEVQEAHEGKVDVTLNHFADVSFSVTTEDLTLEIEDFDEQLLTPAMEAIAQKIDRDLLKLRDDVSEVIGTAAPTTTGGVTTWPGAGGEGYAARDPHVLIEAGKVLNRNKVPVTERRVVVDPEISAGWVATDKLNQANTRGDTEGLREASLGARLFGFDPYMTTNIVDEQGLAFHRNALALVTRPLAIPRGAQGQSATASYKGFGLRVIYGYDMDKKQDVVSIDALYGTKVLDPNLAVLIGAGSVV